MPDLPLAIPVVGPLGRAQQVLLALAEGVLGCDGFGLLECFMDGTCMTANKGE